jgi:hypothetical protein
MYFRKKTSAGRAYLQIVESRREGAASAGDRHARADRRTAGERAVGAAVTLGARFSEKAIVLDALERGESTAISTRRIRPALAFERV